MCDTISEVFNRAQEELTQALLSEFDKYIKMIEGQKEQIKHLEDEVKRLQGEREELIQALLTEIMERPPIPWPPLPPPCQWPEYPSPLDNPPWNRPWPSV